MSTDEALTMKTLLIRRRNKKGILTRAINSISTLIREDAGIDSVKELLEKANTNLEAIEEAHQAVIEKLLEEDKFILEEEWMANVVSKFIAVKIEVERYVDLSRKGPERISEAPEGEEEKRLTDNDDNGIFTKNSNVSHCVSSKEVNDITDGNNSNVDMKNGEGLPHLSSNRYSSSCDSNYVFGFNELKLALELPKAEVFEFNGDPTDYWYFITNFEVNVASKLSGDAARLQYLLQLCKGKARFCIESCALLGDEGYESAKAILKRQFGQPHLILNSLMSKLVSRKSIKANDGESLWKLISEMQRCYVTLTQMGYVNDLNSTSNLLKIHSLLPVYLQTGWANVAQKIHESREPEFNDLLSYLTGQAEISSNMFGRNIGKSSSVVSDEKPRVKSNFMKGRSLKCFACDDDHRIFDCESFCNMSYNQRLDIVRTKRLCFRCLFPGHSVAKCRRDTVCTFCQSNKHNDLLHPPPNQENISVMSNTAVCGSNVFLRILPVTVTGNNGNRVHTLAILDSGSDTTLCSESLRKKLGVKGKPTSYTSSTVNGVEPKIGSTFDITVKGENESNDLSITALSVPKLPNSDDSVPSARDLNRWQHLKLIPWGDISRYNLELLIGADVPEAFWVMDERRGGTGDPYGVKTPLGWSVMGPTGFSGRSDRKNIHRISCCSNGEILSLLKSSWSVDDASIGEGDSVQDKRAKGILESTASLTSEGHYQIGLLWKEDYHYLPSNKPLAESRLRNIKRKLLRDNVMRQKYTETVEGYIAKGYAERVQGEGKAGNVWYLPHHPVVHPHKDKVRVVYDCAAKWRDTSLNSCLLKGPDTINSLVGVLHRFRQQRIALVADVEAMFHQVQVISEDRDVFRFLWWPGGNLESEPLEYRMTVHLFGATSSPACAGYALQRTARDNELHNQDIVGKKAIQFIRNNFYVDDLLASVDDPTVAIEVVERIRSILSKGGFRLTKWVSNDRAVLQSIPESERAPNLRNSLETLPTERTLGVSWNAENDNFLFNVSLPDKPFTRRGLLSISSSIFDPLGFAAPFVVIARCLLQDICRKGSDWDKPLTDEELVTWKKWLQNVPLLSSIQIPRWLQLDNAQRVQLHVFCDASQRGYAAVAYLRVIGADSEASCSFIQGKAKVSPMKPVSIPRLELMGAVLAVTLYTSIKQEIRFDLDKVIFWTDSMIVLGYIRNEDKRFKTFVANRVSKIHEFSSPNQWRHVGSKENPADDGSRGTYDLGTWLSGPSFLSKKESAWPSLKHDDIDLSGDTEIGKSVVLNVTTLVNDNFSEQLISRFSSWTKLVKVLAWVFRFVNKSRGSLAASGLNLSVSEIEASETTIISWVQKSAFKSWQRDQRLFKLKPILLGNVLRAGGRLDNADLGNDVKHPIILPPRGAVVTLIIRYYHESVGHGGLAMTLSAIRQKFWLLNGRTAVKSVVSKCVICRKILARPSCQIMAALPSERVSSDKPLFSFVGVDYFGPFEAKRGRSTVKRFGCIFTCLSSRAVHLEVCESLDADSFLNAFRRFVARRGQPVKIFSDNGSNFQAGEKELRNAFKAMNKDDVEAFLHSKGCEWQFNPPTASHFGGAWERLIRSVRRILRGVLRQQTITDEVLTTVLAEVESILNSRPLTDFSSDPKDEEPLTPNHLLLMRHGPDNPVDAGVSYGRKRWLQVQYLASLFWSRWRKEYLPLLQKRHKWNFPKENVVIGDIVLLTDETIPRGKWPLARIITVFKSSDGKVRSVEVKVRNKILKRPITKLCIVKRMSD
ncbi:uncharacterized protein [Apostichopus japonicus]|uniref:uncharacterized protein n=1 Tax=Stichopus japonicus TaxID=307972 RepID=UPI003AB525E3